jgi:hypothetical protein
VTKYWSRASKLQASGPFRQDLDQAAAGALEARPVLGRAAVEEHQVDVRGDVELAPAQLAHADHDQVLAFQVSERRRNRQLGEVAHRAAHLFERRVAGKIARHHAQQHACPQAPQPATQRRLVVRLATVEKPRHFRARKRPRRGKFFRQLRSSGEERRSGA